MKFRFYAFWLAAIMIVIFGIQFVFPSFTEYFLLKSFSDSLSEPWRFLTAVFLHGGLAHLILNLFALLVFGSVLERFVGGGRFLAVFLVTGILANLFSSLFYDSSLGASGAIFGIIGTLIYIRPSMTVWAFGLPMPLFVAGILWAVGDLLGAYGFFAGNPISNTGNLAHLSGMFFGLVFGMFYRRLVQRRARKVNVSLDERDVRNWERHYLGR